MSSEELCDTSEEVSHLYELSIVETTHCTKERVYLADICSVVAMFAVDSTVILQLVIIVATDRLTRI